LKLVNSLKKRESGQVLISVLALMALGSIMIIPTLGLTTTSLRATEVHEKNVQGLYAADNGLEDALWRLMWDIPETFPYTYQIPNIASMTVNVTISEVTNVFGESIDPGGAVDWMTVNLSVVYDAATENYTFTISCENTGEGNIKIEEIVISFPPDFEYVSGSTSSNITNPVNTNPTRIRGTVDGGQTLMWINGTPRPEIAEDVIEYHNFKLRGPSGMENEILEGAKGFIQVKRSNIGTVWLGGYPYEILSQATDSSGKVRCSLRAGAWATTGLSEISCWQILH
jgi:hypothetical protein